MPDIIRFVLVLAFFSLIASLLSKGEERRNAKCSFVLRFFASASSALAFVIVFGLTFNIGGTILRGEIGVGLEGGAFLIGAILLIYFAAVFRFIYFPRPKTQTRSWQLMFWSALLCVFSLLVLYEIPKQLNRRNLTVCALDISERPISGVKIQVENYGGSRLRNIDFTDNNGNAKLSCWRSYACIISFKKEGLHSRSFYWGWGKKDSNYLLKDSNLTADFPKKASPFTLYMVSDNNSEALHYETLWHVPPEK